MPISIGKTPLEGCRLLGITPKQAGIELKAKHPPKRRDLADTFVALWERFGPHEKYPLVREYRFCPERRWRFDIAFPARLIAIECEGGIWTRGRHTRGKGYRNDLEKYNAAAAMNWRVFRFCANDLDLSPLQTIEQVAKLLEATA